MAVRRIIANHPTIQCLSRPIRSVVELEPQSGSLEGDRFELLLMVIEACEAKYHAIDTSVLVEAIKFRMEQVELTPKDFRPMIGMRTRDYVRYVYSLGNAS